MGKRIILIGHKKRQGKDTFAEMLAEITGGTILRFADPMKQIMATTFGISVAELEDLKNDEITLTHGHQHWNIVTVQTYREVLQRFGTEAMKSVFGPTVWGDLMVKRVNYQLSDTIIIPDFRFCSEISSLLDAFDDVTTVKIVRDSVQPKDIHPSETELDGFPYDFIVYNTGNLGALKEKAKAFAVNHAARTTSN